MENTCNVCVSQICVHFSVCVCVLEKKGNSEENRDVPTKLDFFVESDLNLF